MLKQSKDGLDAGAIPASSTKNTFRNCITCGKKFKVIINHPSVIHCSKKCVVDGAE